MVYREGAFDFYDTIFCAGPHHVKEMRAIEKQRGLESKTLVEHGYARLDSIKKEASTKRSDRAVKNVKQHFLLAPSWGQQGTIETGIGEKIVDLLLSKGKKVTLRPHPQTLKFFPETIQAILAKHETNPDFNYENNVQGQASLHLSDAMICDWSGASLDYAFGLGKPVIFIDVARKVNNPNYEEIDILPFEVDIRESIGTVISPNELDKILDVDLRPLPENLAENYVYNVGRSDEFGAHEIIKRVMQ